MKNPDVTKQLQRLKSTISKASNSTIDDELLGHWGRYCCVLAAGFLENAISLIYVEYARRCGNPKLASYAAARLRKIQNPKTQRFLDVAREFDKKWAEDLKVFTDEDGRKDAIDSIMTNRHLIAHGKTCAVSLGRVQQYLAKAVEVLEFIEGQTGA